MKRVIIAILVFILAAGIGGCDSRESGMRFSVLRINSDSNLSEDEAEYYYELGDYIYQYSLEKSEEEMKKFLFTDEHLQNFAVGKDKIYYVVRRYVGDNWEWTIKQFEYATGRQETFLSVKEIEQLYNGMEDDKITGVMVEICGDELLIQINDHHSTQVYICQMDNGKNLELIDVNDLFPKENKSGATEECMYKDIVIERRYDIEREQYTIDWVRDKESGRNIFINIYEAYVKVNDSDIMIWKGYSGFWYRELGSTEKKKIDCLNGSEYEDSLIYEEKLTVENGEIVGLIPVVKNERCNPYTPTQLDLRYDILFRLNPETGESSIIYKPKNRRTRIIGYKDGIIYLMKRYKVYSQPIGKREERSLLYELPESIGFKFDWQGDHLLIFNDDYVDHELITVLPSKSDEN